ncbi:hypothetical protein [Hymenobacter antarcticus]|uniref:Rieske domain-containing protein n=1 Tax=Hymenobacter antarcticus TaxID=486270 RepID=A0ABP7PZG7_9BACT
MKNYQWNLLARRLSALVLPACVVVLAACGAKNDDQPLIPYAPVNLSINITNQQYAELRKDNGVVTLPVKGPAGDGGVKGVIVVHQAGASYLAFERNCPYQPFNACALVSVDRNSRLFLKDSCCNSQFDLRGQITGGPTPRPLKQYSTSLQGALLNITN